MVLRSVRHPLVIIIIIIINVVYGRVESTKLGEPRVAREKMWKEERKNRFPLLCYVRWLRVGYCAHVRVWRRDRSFCVWRSCNCVCAVLIYYYYYYMWSGRYLHAVAYTPVVSQWIASGPVTPARPI